MPPVIPTIAALAARLYYRINIALITTEFTSPQRKDGTCTYSIAIKPFLLLKKPNQLFSIKGHLSAFR